MVFSLLYWLKEGEDKGTEVPLTLAMTVNPRFLLKFLSARLGASFKFSLPPPGATAALGLINFAAGVLLGVVRGLDLLFQGLGLFFRKQFIETDHYLIRGAALLPPVLDIRDVCLGAANGIRNFHLRHAKALQFEDSVFRFHEYGL